MNLKYKTLIIFVILMTIIGTFFYPKIIANKKVPAIAEEDCILEINMDFFQFSSTTPIIIASNSQYDIFVEKNQLFFETKDNNLISLYTWKKSAQRGKVWFNGSSLLIGVQLDIDNIWHRGEWININLPTTNEDQPSLDIINDSFIGPGEVLSMSISREMSLFLFEVDFGDRPRDFIYISGEKEFHSIMYLGPQHSNIKKDMIHNSVIIELEKPLLFDLPTGPTYLLKDSLGVIVYHTRNNSAFRYYDANMLDYKEFTNHNSTISMGLLQDTAGELYFVVGTMIYTYCKDLWLGKWTMVDENTYYQFIPKGLNLITYKYKNSKMELSINKRITLPKGMKYVNVEDNFIEFLYNNESKYLSIFDLLQNEDIDGITHLLINPLPAFDKVHGTKSISSIRIEKLPYFNRKLNANATIPQEIMMSLDELEVLQGETGHELVFRKFDNKWFVLINNVLHSYKNNKMEMLANLPLSTTIRSGEGMSFVGPQDYLLHKNEWYFTDTFGNRILKLDKSFNTIKEYVLEMPYKLNLFDGMLEVIGIEGSTFLDFEFNLMNKVGSAFRSVTAADISEISIYDESYYLDKESNLIWYYDYLGYLSIYDVNNNQLKSSFLGYLHNTFGKVRIIPYKDNVIVLFDDRLFIFDSNEQFLNSIIYSRGEPDATYYLTTRGENSYQFDTHKGIIYIVQGYRISSIDINTGKISQIFKQNYADIGKIFLHENKLYFTLQPYQYRLYEENFNPYSDDINSELIVYHTESKEFSRYLVKGYFQMDTIENSKISLWREDGDTTRDSQNGTVIIFNLLDISR